MLSQETQKFIDRYKNHQEKNSSEATISVDEVALKVASFYEKIRGIIDWKEEHLLKRSIIERVFRRKILSVVSIVDDKFIINEKIPADSLVLELIRTGHFPNNEIKESKIEQVQRTIDKYIYLINQSNQYQWLSSIAACEIEEILTPSLKQRLLMHYMYHSLKEKIKISSDFEISENEKNVQIYINVQKALFDLDSSVISYHLIKHLYPGWINLDSDKLSEISQKINEIKDSIEKSLDYPLSGKIYQICQKYNTPYLIISDIVETNPENISQPQEFEKLIRENYNQRVKTLKSRLNRAAFYSTVSIFLTNILILLLLEIPFSKYFWQRPSSNYEIEVLGQTLPISFLIATIFFPTLLMAFLVLTVKTPKPTNLEKVIMETMKIAYNNEKKDFYEVKKLRQKGAFFNFLLFFVYSVSFLFSLGIIVWLLSKINYPPFSYLVFVVFLSLIAFAGVKIRDKAQELSMIDEKESFLTTLIDFFALPILYLGKWLSSRWKRYNIVSVFFNALIDMPFSAFIEFIEQWRFFLKEKKEKL